MKVFSIIAACIVFMVATFGGALAKDAIPEGKRLSGQDILATFSDADMYGTFTNGEPDWAERTTADGRVLDLNQQETLVGSWAVANDEACYIYHGKPSALVCYAMHEANGTLLFYNAATGRIVAKTKKIISPKH